MDFIINNIFLVAIAVISGAMLLYPMLRGGAGGPRVDTTEATRLINREDAVVVDVREPAEFANGHILGARNIPLSQLEARAADLQKHKSRPIILSCETGNRSGTAVSVLKAKGFERAVNLAGGFVAWKQAGLPVEK
ncbi:MAG: rhodanese-like domain-containing protein [Burkholderiales bacterium]